MRVTQSKLCSPKSYPNEIPGVPEMTILLRVLLKSWEATCYWMCLLNWYKVCGSIRDWWWQQHMLVSNLCLHYKLNNTRRTLNIGQERQKAKRRSQTKWDQILSTYNILQRVSNNKPPLLQRTPFIETSGTSTWSRKTGRVKTQHCDVKDTQ